MTAMPAYAKFAESFTPRSAAVDYAHDPRLAAVLLGKPVAEEVPLAAWWLLAESLQYAVAVRRVIEGVEALTPPDLGVKAGRARSYGEAALEELDPVPTDAAAVGARTSEPSAPSCAPTLRAMTSVTARLIVSSRTVTVAQLRGAILLYLDALRRAAQ
jgi:hypothetical protein